MELIFGLSFGIIGITVILFVVLIAAICIVVAKCVAHGRTEKNLPKTSVSARVIGKRMRFSRVNGHRSICRYFATFETEGGNRIELMLPEREYGVIIENDFGILVFQGKTFLGFDRK